MLRHQKAMEAWKNFRFCILKLVSSYHMSYFMPITPLSSFYSQAKQNIQRIFGQQVLKDRFCMIKFFSFSFPQLQWPIWWSSMLPVFHIKEDPRTDQDFMLEHTVHVDSSQVITKTMFYTPFFMSSRCFLVYMYCIPKVIEIKTFIYS